MIKISLITPTRNRPDDLKRLIKSLEKTTSDLNSIELLLAVDNDDKKTQSHIRKLQEQYKSKKKLFIRVFYVDRSDHFSKDYYNFLSNKTDGRWIIGINDDSIFMTEGWDTIICERMEAAALSMGDDILFGIINDGMFVKGSEADKRTFSCWPLLSKEYSDLMGGILIEEIYTWGGDFWLGRIFVKVQGGRRRVYIKEVLVEHNSHHSNPKKEEKDHLSQPESFELFQRIESEHPCTFNSKGVTEKLMKITNYLNSK